MNKTDWVMLLVSVLGIAFLVFNLGRASVEPTVVTPSTPVPTVVSEPPTREELNDVLIKQILEAVTSANITAEYDSSGYSRGTIILHWDQTWEKPKQ